MRGLGSASEGGLLGVAKIQLPIIKQAWPWLDYFSPCPALGDPDEAQVRGDAEFDRLLLEINAPDRTVEMIYGRKGELTVTAAIAPAR